MKLKPFKFDGNGLNIRRIMVQGIISLSSNMVMSFDILNPKHDKLWFWVDIIIKTSRKIKIRNKVYNSRSLCVRSIITDGDSFYNLTWTTKPKSPIKTASRRRTIANKLNDKNKSSITDQINKYVKNL